MAKQRCECERCNHFTFPVFKSYFPPVIVSKANCKLGKRVMFRNPRHPHDENFGWIRYCNDFSKKCKQ